jgi:dTDP-4-dehydrorhamnose reductase
MYNKEDKILIIGAGGQIGIELVQELSKLYGSSNVIAADVKPIPALEMNPFEKLDVLDKDALLNVVKNIVFLIYIY